MQYKDIDRVTWPQCQKVLPLTYDNSLSYYEAICKLVETLNQVIAIVNEIDLSVLDDLRNRIAECERDNIEQDNSITYLNECCKTVNELIDKLNSDVSELSERINSVSTIVSMHTVELENHEVRITELEKYQSQMLLKKEVANLHIGDLFNMQAEEFERSEIHV